MTEPDFPPDLINAWLDSLPPPVESGLRNKLALDAECVLGERLDWIGAAPRGTLRDAISAFFHKHPGATAVAVVCAMIDVQVYRMDDQERLDRRHESRVQDLSVVPKEERAQHARILEAHPLRSRQWVRATTDWRALRVGPLSPDAISKAYWFEHPPLRDLLPPQPE